MIDTSTLIKLHCDRGHGPTYIHDGDEFADLYPCPWCLADDHWALVLKHEHARDLRKHRRHLGASTRLACWLASWGLRLRHHPATGRRGTVSATAA